MEKIKDISLYKPITAYQWELDNKPLEELVANDVRLQKQVDALLSRLFETVKLDFTRSHFNQLKPSVNQRNPSRVDVAAGTFICRMPTRSGPWDSDKPLGSGLNTRETGLETNRDDADMFANEDYHGYGESQRTAAVFYRGGSVSFEPWDDNDFNWAGAGNPNPPEYRVDLICVQGFPADDQSGANPTVLGSNEGPNLVVVKGAGWRNFPVVTSSGDFSVNNFAESLFKGEDPNITASKPLDGYYYGPGTSIHPDHGASKYWDSSMAPSPGITRAKTYALSREGLDAIDPDRDAGTIPAPDDIINASFHVTPSHTDTFVPATSSLDLQSWAGTVATDQVGLFCVPLAYVRIPRGYAGGNIRSVDVKDIRPLIRTTELTLSEREGLANMYKPQAENRVITVMDADYTALVDFILRDDQWNRYELQGMWNNSNTPQRGLIPGNHEGRLRALEWAVKRPSVQTAPNKSFDSTPIPFSNGQSSNTYYQSRQYGENWREAYGAGPKPYPGYKAYDPGLYYQPGQYIPCVRNYLNRFYTEVYDPRERAARRGAPGGYVFEDAYRIFGASQVQVRRQVVRDQFLAYSSEESNPSLPFQAFRVDWGGHYAGNGPVGAVNFPGLGPNVSDQYPERNRYKMQTVELDFVFPEYDPDRDAHEECKEVWHQGDRGRGWSGFGHGGSYDDAGWVTVCQTVDDDKYAQTEVGFSFPRGWMPYWIDVDALGFAPGTIDCLQINCYDLGDFVGDQGQRVLFRFNKGVPRYHREDYLTGQVEEAGAYSVTDPLATLDMRRRYIDTRTGTWSSTGAMGERISYKDNGVTRAVTQVSYGYQGFCLLMWMGGDSSDWDFREGRTYTQGPWKAKKSKIVITGPAHTFYNGAFLPTANNSDTGNSPAGESWID